MLPPANWVIAAATLYVPSEPHLQEPTGNISPSEEKPYKVLMPALGSDVERCFYVQSCMMVKKDIEIQPGFEPGSSEF